MVTILLQWLVDCVLSVLALAGYVTYYNQLLNGDAKTRRVRIDVMILAVAAGLQVAQWIDPTRFKVYGNLQLLVLAFPLLGTDMDRRHLLVRFCGLAGFTALNHWGMPWWGYVVGVGGQVVIVLLMQRWYAYLREHFLANTAVMALLVAGYWLPRGDLDWTARVGLIVTYLVISGVNFWYWLALRRSDRRYSQLAHRADFDPLTNAASYALFRRDAQRAFRHAKARQHPLAVMTIDIDYFKRINDHYGHPVGDAVLIAALRRLEKVLTPAKARIYRTGGEEFTVLLPHLDAAAAEAVAVRCCQVMRSAPLAAGAEAIDVTISVGMDELTAADEDFAALGARVDADLYRSKARGRDTVTVAGKTLWRHDRLTVSHFFTEYTQTVQVLATKRPLAVAMMTRYWAEAPHAWVPADRWSMALREPLRFLAEAATTVGLATVDLDVTAAQFAAPATLPQLTTWLAANRQVDRLRVIIHGAPSPAVLETLAPDYRRAGCVLLLHPAADDQWRPCLPFVAGVVCELQRDPKPLQQGLAKVALPLLVRQVDTAALLVQAQTLAAAQVSGAYFGDPVLPQVAARTNRDQVD